MGQKTITFFAAVALCSATAVDIALKFAALSGSRIGHGPLRFELFENPGIAFSLPVPLHIVTPLTAVLLIGVIVAIYRSHNAIIRLFLLSALLGATSNLIDRLVHDFTTDYIIVHRLAINIADILIIVGIVGATWYTQQVQTRR